MAIDPNNLAGTASLTFSDEFNGQTLDTAKWGTGYPWGAANGSTNTSQGEAEWYINADYAPTAHLGTYTVANGVLDIKEAPADAATQALVNGYQYTSGMVNSEKSFSQTYGYFEMRADIPDGQGMWPAFWLLQGGGAWPPELDVMEVVGSSPDSLVTTVHWDQNGHQFVNKATEVPGLSSGGMHTYGVDWQPDTITWYLDGKQVYEAATPADMHQPMYMLANLAAGGQWAGQPDGSTNHMLIDYIRAYSEMPGGGTPPPSDSGSDTAQPVTAAPSTEPVTQPATAPTTAAPVTEPAAPAAYADLPWTADPTHTVTTSAGAAWGGAGNDALGDQGRAATLTGAAGDDTYTVTSAATHVSEATGGGVDLVRTTLSNYTLPDNVENLQLNGSGPQTATGNAGDNYLLASAWNEAHLSGGAGDDALVAKHGPATMTGGAGADSFRFDELPWQAGHVTDFQSGTDVIDLRNLLKVTGYTGGDPLADGHLSLTQNAAGGTDVAFDAWGSGPTPLTTIDHVQPAQLHHGDWMFA
ncbi:family 16 glycosylhydrolase [Methylorubrum sp. SB2]|uniref:family 16 glycosylhydrolase n=1 Tax=Methylorubrum subtropicum TaxID=3138812 RepID=UPI00313BE434